MPRRKARPVQKKVTALKLPVTKPVRFRFQQRTTPVEKIADVLTGFFGTLWFLGLNVLFFVGWIVWNSGLNTSFSAFDPYPFGMLTMTVSLEAIVLSVVVLISQNRSSKRADTREEIDFEIDVASEKQIAAIMQSLDLILHHMEINHTDDMKAMEEINVEKLQRRVIHDIDTD
ncbi:MAG: DUF1003 domain-containing protein [Patescibacteria group bacterium]